MKLDGYWLFARIDGARVKLVTRRGNDWTKKFRPIVTALASLKVRSGMLDGEIVHLNPDGTSSFGALQEDLSEGRPDRLSYFLFDLLTFDGYVLTGCRLEDRKRALEQIVARALLSWARECVCERRAFKSISMAWWKRFPHTGMSWASAAARAAT